MRGALRRVGPGERRIAVHREVQRDAGALGRGQPGFVAGLADDPVQLVDQDGRTGVRRGPVDLPPGHVEAQHRRERRCAVERGGQQRLDAPAEGAEHGGPGDDHGTGAATGR